jgi:cbb3-type cytochrome oxidase subunit 3
MGTLSTYAGVAGLLIFFTFFIGVCVWIYRPGTRVRYKNYAQIPLDEKEQRS